MITVSSKTGLCRRRHREIRPCPCPIPGHYSQYNKPQGEVYHSWLKKAANDDIKVPNLKSVIETTVPNITTLQAVILGSFTEMRMGATDASDYSHTHAVVCCKFFFCYSFIYENHVTLYYVFLSRSVSLI